MSVQYSYWKSNPGSYDSLDLVQNRPCRNSVSSEEEGDICMSFPGLKITSFDTD